LLLNLFSCLPLASGPSDYEADGASVYSVGEGRPISPLPPPVTVKREREAVVDAEDGEHERQRKRRRTDFTQATLVNPTQHNPFRGSPLSKAAASERVPSQGLMTPTGLPKFDFTKHIPTKHTPVRPLPVMDFTSGKAKRRESVARGIADQTFELEDEEEVANVAISKEEGSRPSRHHQEEVFGAAAELQAPLKRQRKSKLNLDLIPAMTYQSQITFFHLLPVITDPFMLAVRTGARTRSQSRAATPHSDAHIIARTSARKPGQIGSQRRANARH
jgi:hypothetical protein